MSSSKNQSLALVLFSIGVFMAALDNGIISAALTTINDSFGVSANWGAWGVTIYTLGLAISVPIVGKLSDRYGRRKLFIVEVALFGLGSLLVALSPSFEFYIVSRFIQAMGGGGIFIIGSSHILSTMPKEQHGKALGMLGGMNGIAAVLGPNIGSIILDLTNNWKYLFLINIPIAIVLVWLGTTKLKESKDPGVGKLDLLGTVLLSLSILGIMYGITNIENMNSLTNPEVYAYLAAGVVIFVILLFHERKLEIKGGDPILPMQLLAKPAFLLTLLIGACSGALLAGMIFIPAFSEQVLGIAQQNSGYWMTPLAIAAGIGAAVGGIVSDKKGPIVAVLLSGVISVIGFWLFPAWIDFKWQFIIASIIAGVGMGIILGAPLNMLATENLQHKKGSALATLSLTRQIGMTLAPTIYAGFISRSYSELPNKMQTDFQTVFTEETAGSASLLEGLRSWISSVNFSSITDSTQIMGLVGSIENEELRQAVLSTINRITLTAAEQGYAGLYYTAVVIAALIVVLTLILQPIRKKALQKQQEEA